MIPSWKHTSLLRSYHLIFQSTQQKHLTGLWILFFGACQKHRSQFPRFSRNVFFLRMSICYLFQESTHSTNRHLFKWKKQPCPRNCANWSPNSTSIHPKKTPQNRRFFLESFNDISGLISCTKPRESKKAREDSENRIVWQNEGTGGIWVHFPTQSDAIVTTRNDILIFWVGESLHLPLASWVGGRSKVHVVLKILSFDHQIEKHILLAELLPQKQIGSKTWYTCHTSLRKQNLGTWTWHNRYAPWDWNIYLH